jgi:hypothetical protein
MPIGKTHITESERMDPTEIATANLGLIPMDFVDRALDQLRSTRLVNGNLLDAVSRAEPILKEFAVLAIMSQLQKIAADMLNFIEAGFPAPTQERVTSWKN